MQGDLPSACASVSPLPQRLSDIYRRNDRFELELRREERLDFHAFKQSRAGSQGGPSLSKFADSVWGENGPASSQYVVHASYAPRFSGRVDATSTSKLSTLPAEGVL